MVEIVKISKTGQLLEIKEISDRYRYEPFNWEENEHAFFSFLYFSPNK